MELQNGTIIQHPYHEGSSKLTNAVQKMIVRVQDGSTEVHSQVHLDGYIYEFTVGAGAKKTAVADFNFKDRYFYLDPIKEMTEAEVIAGRFWWEFQLLIKATYNYAKLFTCFILAWSKPFWNKIGYVPFSNAIFGEFCSAGVDRFFKFIKWDLIPNQIEGFTSCADLNGSVMHKRRL